MTKRYWIILLVVAAVVSVAARADHHGKAMTWSGWISDSACAAEGAKASHKECAQQCVKAKGAKWVFVERESGKVLGIENQDAVKESHLGMEVKLTGQVKKDKRLQVEKIEPAQQAAKPEEE